MVRFIACVASVLGCLVLLNAARAQPPSAKKGDVRHVEARLVAEHTAFYAGDGNWIGIHFKIAPKWHLYWNGVNDSGFAPKVKWHAPAGVTIGELLWPAPVRHISEGDILDHIYENEVTLIAPVTLAPEAMGGDSIEIKASVEWLVCEEVCVPEDAELSLSVPVRKTREARQPGPDAGAFGAARTRIPSPLQPTDARVSVDIRGSTATIKARDGKGLSFYPLDGCSKLARPIEGAVSDGNELNVELDGKGKPVSLRGVVEVGAKEKGQSPILVSVQIPAK